MDFLSGLLILYVKFANLEPLRRHGTARPAFLFWIFKVDQIMIAHANFNGFQNVTYFFKWTISFICHCHLVEYPTIPSKQASQYAGN